MPETIEAELVEVKPKKEIEFRKRRGSKKDKIFTRKMISEDDRKFIVHFPVENEEEYKPLLMQIPTCRYQGTRPWNPDDNIPPEKLTYLAVYQIDASDETLQRIAQFGKSHRFDFDSDIAIRAFGATTEGKILLKMSYQKSTSEDLNLPKLNGKPYPFQYAGLAYIQRTKKTFVADEMGLGKTVEGILAIASSIKEATGPWLILAPKSLRRTWYRHIKRWLKYVKVDRQKIKSVILQNKHFKTNRKGVLLKESKAFLAQQDVMICNYDMVAKFLPHLKIFDWFGFICDESHYVKGSGALRTRVTKDLVTKSNAEYVLLLSGTPLVNNPRDLINQLAILGRLGDFGGTAHFIRRYCCIRTDDIAKVAEMERANEANSEISPEDQQHIQDALTRQLFQNMSDLNTTLRSSCYLRREKSAVLEFLPAKTRSTILVDITNRKLYQRIEDDVCEYLGDMAVKDEKFLKSIKKLPKKVQEERIRERRASRVYRASRAKALVRLQNLKKYAAVGKMKAAKEWINNYLESGQKLVVFSHHKIIQRELQEEFPDAVNTFGKGKDKAEDRFQKDRDVNLWNGSIERDGVGLTLHAASATCTLEFRWNPAKHDQAEDRIHRIGQTEACTNYYLLAVDTVEERIAALIEKKRRIVNAVADGDPLKGVEQGSLSVADELIEEYKKKGIAKARAKAAAREKARKTKPAPKKKVTLTPQAKRKKVRR